VIAGDIPAIIARTMTARRRIQRFEIVEQIGTGGAGQVYRGRDPELERDVAIKVLAASRPPCELSPDDTLDLRKDGPLPRDELLREARIMARLSHPNVLPVYEVGLSDDTVFLVMEHIDGSDLATWLDEPRSTEAILEVFLQAARGLAEAHHRGIVHRDVKPGNILIDRDGRVRVADFGLSRLTARSPTALMYLNDGRGTPRYMAPELLHGEPATPRSDVYALCVALVEALGGQPAGVERALRERGIGGRLRRILERGLSDDPAVRPALGEIVDVLGRRPPRWRTWAIGAAAAVAVIVAAVALRPSPAESLACEADPAQLSTQWNAGQLAAVTRVLAAQPGSRAAVERIAGDIAALQRAIDASLAGACSAARAGQITRDQYLSRASCLQRRIFTLTATMDLLIDTPLNLLKARDRLETSLLPDECIGMTAAPIAGDPAIAEALWRRYIRSGTMAVPMRATEHIAELTAIATAAAAIGEAELIARATRWLAVEQRFDGQLALADDTFQRAYRMALDLKATALAAQVLVDRGTLALLRDDATAARNYVDLARDLADTEASSPQLRARIALLRGRTLNVAGDYTGALATLRRALDMLTSDSAATTTVELDVRDNLLAALVQIDVQVPQTIDLANETAELARGLVGEHDMRYGWALDLVAMVLSAADDHVRAAGYRRKAIEILEETLPADHALLRRVRNYLAVDLYNLGDLESAQRVIMNLLAIPAKYVESRWYREGFFALVAFEGGDLDGSLARATHALEEAISDYGRHHPDTLELRCWVATMELELGRLDAAARDIAAIDDGYRAQPEIHRLRRIRLSGRLAAELAIARGKPGDAEAAARHALAAAGELRASDRDRAHFHASLGRSLVAQRRWAEAGSALEASLVYLDKIDARRDDIAAIEIELATAEAGLGQRASALARARRARAVLDDYPGRLRARDQADRLLGKVPRHARPT
jgi:tetratricopeptide (TPR) repeat protein/predicted Ser/Thr protein kinase